MSLITYWVTSSRMPQAVAGPCAILVPWSPPSLASRTKVARNETHACRKLQSDFLHAVLSAQSLGSGRASRSHSGMVATWITRWCHRRNQRGPRRPDLGRSHAGHERSRYDPRQRTIPLVFRRSRLARSVFLLGKKTLGRFELAQLRQLRMALVSEVPTPGSVCRQICETLA